jgi:S-adenosylmethionine:tRNA ribosyltransferase-isomerase
MDINLFDFALPEELIAQNPLQKRDECKLMVIDREHKTITHRQFHDIVEYLKPAT